MYQERKVKVSVTQSCSTLCNPMDCSPPGSSVHGKNTPGENTGVGCHSLLQGYISVGGIHEGIRGGKKQEQQRHACANRSLKQLMSI